MGLTAETGKWFRIRAAAAAVLICWTAVLGTARVRAASPAWEALVRRSGAVSLRREGREVVTVEPGLFESPWRPGEPLRIADHTERPRAGTIRAPGGVIVDSVLRADPVQGGVRLHYTLTPREAIELNSLYVGVTVPIRHVAGQQFAVDGEPGVVPTDFRDPSLSSGTARRVDLTLAGGDVLRITLDEPVHVLVQDNRRWEPTLVVRLGPSSGQEQPWPGGRSLQIAFTMTTREDIEMELDEPVTIQQGEDWVPLELELDIEPGSAVDFSGFGQFDPPAGRHGRLIATPEGRFVFEDDPDTPRRFYGVNLCFSGQYMSHEEADRLAERLMRLGYNTVRFHHHERDLVDDSGGTTTTFCPDRLDQLDYLFAALKERGIYMTTDLYVSRRVWAGEVWPGAEGRVAMDDFKMLVLVNERAMENFLEFSRNLLTHRNPYTGMTWGEDPALAWLSLINEGNAGNFIGRIDGRVAEEWRRAWNEWLAARYEGREDLAEAWGEDPEGDPARGTVPLARNIHDDNPKTRDLVVFLAETERDAFRRIRSYLREELDCHALLTNINSWTAPVQMQAVRAEFDYVDEHFYVDHPQWVDRPWQLPSRSDNTSPIAAGAPGGRDKAFIRLLDRPFTISEYNYSGPGRFRGVGGILTGCMAALQGWDTLWRFAYSHRHNMLFEPAPAGYFDLASDPLNQTAERAALALYLRGDMREASHTVAVPMTPTELLQAPRRNTRTSPPWHALALVTGVGTHVAEQPGEVAADVMVPLAWGTQPDDWTGGDVLALDPYEEATGAAVLAHLRESGLIAPDNVTDLSADRLQSETGELLVNAPDDVMVLNTPRTAGGYAPEGGRVEAGPVTVTMDETYATVWVSSLDEEPIRSSGRMLVAHLTDLQNSGAHFAERDRQTLLEWGGLPHLVRDGAATLTVEAPGARRARAWAIATSGRRVAPVEVDLEDGRITLPLRVRGPEGARMMYEVEVTR